MLECLHVTTVKGKSREFPLFLLTIQIPLACNSGVGEKGRNSLASDLWRWCRVRAMCIHQPWNLQLVILQLMSSHGGGKKRKIKKVILRLMTVGHLRGKP